MFLFSWYREFRVDFLNVRNSWWKTSSTSSDCVREGKKRYKTSKKKSLGCSLHQQKMSQKLLLKWVTDIIVKMKNLEMLSWQDFHVPLQCHLNNFYDCPIFLNSSTGWRCHRQRIRDIRYGSHRRNPSNFPVLVDVHNMACLFSYLGYALRNRHWAEVRNSFLHVFAASWNLLQHACKTERKEGSQRVQRL